MMTSERDGVRIEHFFSRKNACISKYTFCFFVVKTFFTKNIPINRDVFNILKLFF